MYEKIGIALISILTLATILPSGTTTVAAAGIAKDCEKARDYRVRLRACDKLVRQASKNRARLANAYRKRAIARMSLNASVHDIDFAKHAHEDFTKAIKILPRKSELYFERSKTYDLIIDDLGYDEKRELAIKDLTKAISINPKSAKYFSKRGFFHSLLNNREKSIADHMKAIRLEPKEMGFYSGRAQAYRRFKEYKKAISDYTFTIKKFKHPRHYWNSSLSHKWRAEVYEKIGEIDLAIADWKKITDIRKSNPLLPVPDFEIKEALIRLTALKAGSKKELLRFHITAGGEYGGVFHSIARKICETIQKETKSYLLSCSAVTSKDRVESLTRLIGFGIASAELQAEAHNGTGRFREHGPQETLRSVLSLHRARSKRKGATLVVANDMPNEVVAAVVMSVAKGLKSITEASPLTLSGLQLKDLAKNGLTAPLHPGASEAFKSLNIVR